MNLRIGINNTVRNNEKPSERAGASPLVSFANKCERMLTGGQFSIYLLFSCFGRFAPAFTTTVSSGVDGCVLLSFPCRVGSYASN